MIPVLVFYGYGSSKRRRTSELRNDRRHTQQDDQRSAQSNSTSIPPQGKEHVHLWVPWTAEDKHLLERVQQQAVKMVSGLRGKTYEERK